MKQESAEAEKQKAAQRTSWEKGNFGLLADTLGADEAQRFVDRLPISPGMRALDIACGTGAATLPLARRGATVTGLDMVSRHLAEADMKARVEGLCICFDEGFMEELPYPDQTYDVVVSMFGVMFSQDPDKVVAEIARVLKPGGLLGLANWTTAGFSGIMSAIPASYMSPSPTSISPMLWGDEETVQERLSKAFASVECNRVTFDWSLRRSPAESAAFFIENAGPILTLLSRLDEEKRCSFQKDIVDLWVEKNTAHDASETIIQNEYLTVLARLAG